MGCWNATCHLSNLPIGSGEPVVVIPIIESIITDRTKEFYNFYPNSIYEPFMPAIHGITYNAYGGIQGEYVDSINPVVLDCLKSLVFYQYEDNENDVEEKRDEMLKRVTFVSIDDFINKIERSISNERYIYILRNGKTYKVNFVMYLEDIYNGLLDVWNTKTNVETKINRVIDFYNSDSEFKFLREYPDSVVWYSKLMFRLYSNPEDIQKFAKEIIEVDSIASILGYLRRGFMCMTGSGSQNENYEFHFLLNSLIRQHIIEKEKEILPEICNDEFYEKYDLENNEVTDEITIEYMKNNPICIW